MSDLTDRADQFMRDTGITLGDPVGSGEMTLGNGRVIRFA